MKNVIFAFLFLQALFFALAEEPEPKFSLPATCGNAIESSFVQSGEIHEYKITMSAGDKLTITVTPVGEYLSTWAKIWEPAGNVIFEDRNRKNPFVAETKVLSSTGDYIVRVFNSDANNYNSGGLAGTYTFNVSCILRDGTAIEAGTVQ